MTPTTEKALEQPAKPDIQELRQRAYELAGDGRFDLMPAVRTLLAELADVLPPSQATQAASEQAEWCEECSGGNHSSHIGFERCEYVNTFNQRCKCPVGEQHAGHVHAYDCFKIVQVCSEQPVQPREAQDGEVVLLPCPFCGSSSLTISVIDANEINGRIIECEHCEGRGPEKTTDAKAVAAWNRRPSIDPPKDWGQAWQQWSRTHPTGITCMHSPLDPVAPSNDLQSRLLLAFEAGVKSVPSIDPLSLTAERCAEILNDRIYKGRNNWRADRSYRAQHEDSDVSSWVEGANETCFALQDAQIIAAWLLEHGEVTK